jgi:hypothetical protein
MGNENCLYSFWEGLYNDQFLCANTQELTMILVFPIQSMMPIELAHTAEGWADG